MTNHHAEDGDKKSILDARIERAYANEYDAAFAAATIKNYASLPLATILADHPQLLTLGCYAVFNEPVRQLLQGRDGTAHARRKASCSKSRQQCPGCLTCGSYLIKLSLRLGLYFADLLSLTR